MPKKYFHFMLLCFLIPSISLSESPDEDWDEDEDLEYFFSTRQKSTLEDFPLQEIGGEELSNAAIAGALKADTSSGQNAKPIYLQEKEDSDKQKAGDALKEDELLKAGEDLQLNQFQIPTAEFQQPIYSQPTGRTYSAHSTNTISRP
ncbi:MULTISPECIES: hypothetical protein [unclassified Oleiphilus]|jgi:hypothetical protein|uniref:hypothetical protein n=2 Tax=Oleiphilus TaxID=141450 RepID=UPI0007C3BAA1|nr:MULTISPECIES: hypothetical protein [unclassified Oleiphilus]KZY45539.1 hypothetical protein A3732_10175 [Oleiphilus sp. HI0050]KZY77443.1 hypothetical protein A3740_10435 [Oleiphilus sp. HI0068]KZY78470.1 hypothetical protein A3741_21630 [Oleiphilus sp. HI0069]KZY86114.1 hypothetical protein A3743_02790 [Oleiphilus sp. HI0072]KZZ12097.1 hypothetical protein A3749_00055 [Oleiphilus sp. HI0078]KZZ39017.1 hypothetical protein A3755_04845 [Oleiphilus sp. HI0085]